MTLIPCDRAPQLTAIDIYDPGLPPAEREVLLDELLQVQARHFPDYSYMADTLATSYVPPDTVAHAWLLRVDGAAVGEFLFHTSLGRRIVQIHYVAMDAQISAVLPRGWLADVTDAAMAVSTAEAEAQGVELLAMAGEMYSNPVDYRRWRRKGFLILALDYREPFAGQDWASQPDDFRQTTIGVRLTEAGRAMDPGAVVEAVLASFLLDFYGMPADHPQVVRMFDEASGLGLTELPDEVIEGQGG